MTSKYDALRAAMGGEEVFNDKASNGRILKWYAATCGATLQERKVMAAEVLRKLKAAGLGYVQKVEVRNATSTASRFDPSGGIMTNTIADDDKICVYISNLK